jgi:hypothetical protein
VDRLALRTDAAQFRGSTGLVLHFDEKRAPTLLHELRFGWPRRNLHPHFRVDVQAHQAMRIQNGLNVMTALGRIALSHRRVQRLPFARGQGCSQVIQRLDQSLDLRAQRLEFHAIDDWQGRFGRGSRERKTGAKHEGRGTFQKGFENRRKPAKFIVHCCLSARPRNRMQAAR